MGSLSVLTDLEDSWMAGSINGLALSDSYVLGDGTPCRLS